MQLPAITYVMSPDRLQARQTRPRFKRFTAPVSSRPDRSRAGGYVASSRDALSVAGSEQSPATSRPAGGERGLSMSTYPRQARRAAVAVVAATALLASVGVHVGAVLVDLATAATTRGDRLLGDRWMRWAPDSRHIAVAGSGERHAAGPVRHPGGRPGHEPCDRPVQAHARGLRGEPSALVAGREADRLQPRVHGRDTSLTGRMRSTGARTSALRRGAVSHVVAATAWDPQAARFARVPARRRTSARRCSRRTSSCASTGARGRHDGASCPGRAPG